jgi:hypothetical protein
VSESLSDRRLTRGGPEGPGTVAPEAGQTLHVRAVFRDVDDAHVQILAAEMIARAHELANRPECACDVDVSVQYAAPAAPLDEC